MTADVVQLEGKSRPKDSDRLSEDMVAYLQKVFAKKVNHLGKYVYFIQSDIDQRHLHPDAIVDTIVSVFDVQITSKSNYKALVSRILKHVPNTIGKTYKPLQPRLAPVDDVVNMFEINTYTAPVWNDGLIPADKLAIDDMDLFWDFIARMFPIESERKYMLKWLAFTVHQPDKKARVIPLLTSEQGVGKGFLLTEIVAPLVGEDNFDKTTMQRITGRFNGGLGQSVVVFIDELYSDKKRNSDALKEIISDDKVQIERKFENSVTQRIYANLIAASNSENAIFIESHDRRWFVPQYIKHRVDKDETAEFIEKLAYWLENENGLQMVNSYLKIVDDLNTDEKFRVAPMTDTKSDTKADDISEKWEQLLADNYRDTDITKVVLAKVNEQLDTKIPESFIRKCLKKFGYESTNKKMTYTLPNGKKTRLRYWERLEVPDNAEPMDDEDW